MTVTTMVLSMPAEVTMPSRTLRGLGRVVGLVSHQRVSSCLERFGGRDLAGAELGVDAGDRRVRTAVEPGVVVELAGDELEAQVEQLFLRLGEALDEARRRRGRGAAAAACWPSERLLTGDEAGLDRQLLDGPLDGARGRRSGSG